MPIEAARVLTLTQPWASLVAWGEKRVETRSWQTPHRGWIVIRAAQGLLPVGGMEGCREQSRQRFFREVLERRGLTADALPRGAALAVARLATILPAEDAARHLPPREIAFGDFGAGRYAWMLEDLRPIPPVCCPGQLGLPSASPSILAVVNRALRNCTRSQDGGI